MRCEHFEAGRCDSCSWMAKPYLQQLREKELHLHALLDEFDPERWCDSVPSEETAFRNKAKMAVIGSPKGIVLGLLNRRGEAVSLVDCPLYPEPMQALLAYLQKWIGEAGLTPYRVDKKRGEAKFVLLTRSTTGEYLLRLVLRSTAQLEKIKEALPVLLKNHPEITVVSVNIQPVHMARLEGEEEIFLSERTRLKEVFNDIPLYIRPKSFFQTNPGVAAALYRTAREWSREEKPKSVWDLFCGVGGFGLHCADGKTALTGIEIEQEAITCAILSAEELGLKDVRFRALDSKGFADESAEVPELVIVNPPRRGIGGELATGLNRFAPKRILYSSCNAKTLADDLKQLTRYRIRRVCLFDMFPHTDHYEVLVELVRSGTH